MNVLFYLFIGLISLAPYEASCVIWKQEELAQLNAMRAELVEKQCIAIMQDMGVLLPLQAPKNVPCHQLITVRAKNEREMAYAKNSEQLAEDFIEQLVCQAFNFETQEQYSQLPEEQRKQAHDMFSVLLITLRTLTIVSPDEEGVQPIIRPAQIIQIAQAHAARTMNEVYAAMEKRTPQGVLPITKFCWVYAESLLLREMTTMIMQRWMFFNVSEEQLLRALDQQRALVLKVLPPLLEAVNGIVEHAIS